jgi:hypothetical protein
VSLEPVSLEIQLNEIAEEKRVIWRNLLIEEEFLAQDGRLVLRLAPYQVLWLTPQE